MEVLIRKGTELDQGEIDQVDEVRRREFGAQPLKGKDFGDNLFFFLVEKGRLLVVGGLISIEPVHFAGESFSLLGIGGVAANEKGRGYGGQVVREIKRYLERVGKTGVGFCKVDNRGFYEKCGFSIDEASLRRFVYLTGNERITNTTDDLLIYVDGKDNFMKKVLTDLEGDVILPRPPDW